jgi:hypothetical protein
MIWSPTAIFRVILTSSLPRQSFVSRYRRKGGERHGEDRDWRADPRRAGGGFLQDCDQASVNTGILPINVGGQNAICLSQ